MELSADPNCWAIWASWKCMDLDVPSLFQNRRVKIPGLESLRWHAQWSSGHHTSCRHKKCDFYYINIINTACLLQRKPKSQEHLKMKSASEILAFFETDSQPWCLCHRHQRYLAVCFYSHISLEFNTIPSRWMVPGWEAVDTVCSSVSRHLPLLHARDALQQESRVLQKLLQCYWMKDVDPFAGSDLTPTDHEWQKNSLSSNVWKFALKLKALSSGLLCDIILERSFMNLPVKCKPLLISCDVCHCSWVDPPKKCLEAAGCPTLGPFVRYPHWNSHF